MITIRKKDEDLCCCKKITFFSEENVYVNDIFLYFSDKNLLINIAFIISSGHVTATTNLCMIRRNIRQKFDWIVWL